LRDETRGGGCLNYLRLPTFVKNQAKRAPFFPHPERPSWTLVTFPTPSQLQTHHFITPSFQRKEIHTQITTQAAQIFFGSKDNDYFPSASKPIYPTPKYPSQYHAYLSIHYPSMPQSKLCQEQCNATPANAQRFPCSAEMHYLFQSPFPTYFYIPTLYSTSIVLSPPLTPSPSF
jgi:hypothetical protein